MVWLFYRDNRDSYERSRHDERERSARDWGRSSRIGESSSRDRDRSSRDKERSSRDRERSSRDRERSSRDKERSSRDRSSRDRDRSSRDRERSSRGDYRDYDRENRLVENEMYIYCRGCAFRLSIASNMNLTKVKVVSELAWLAGQSFPFKGIRIQSQFYFFCEKIYALCEAAKITGSQKNFVSKLSFEYYTGLMFS